MSTLRLPVVAFLPAMVAAGMVASMNKASRSAPLAAPETYRTSAGRVVNDTLVVTLESQQVRWMPQGEQRAEVMAFTFAEPGTAPRVPGPMIRHVEGGVVRLTLRNTQPKRMVVRGFVPRPQGNLQDSIAVMPGRDTTITFVVGAPGSYFYWARTTPTVRHRVAPIPDWMWSGEAEEGPFVGALVVDPRGTIPNPHERTFLINRWLDEYAPGLADTVDWKVTVNGGSYPNTEPLAYTVGDSVRWRVINASLTSHPMHLHGFYFRVTGKGDASQWRTVPHGEQHDVVTEFLDAGESMTMTWVPERPGNWLFHCHLTRHMTSVQDFPVPSTANAGGAPAVHDAAAHGMAGHNMAGLVMGITVRAAPGGAAARAEARAAGRLAPPVNERKLALFAQTRAKVFGTQPGFAFVAQRGGRAPVSDSITVPSRPLLLKRGEPARITVHNRLASPLSVHWHGMELESWFDGVGSFSGMGARMRAPIAPRDSFVVRFTPPRAGTFMMHTHDEAGDELASGLYGALLVLDDPATFDARRDHVVLLATHGPGPKGMVAVNGRHEPESLTLQAGVTHRLRFASIPSNERLQVSLVKRGADTTVTVREWQMLAVDGAELPVAQQRTVTATRSFGAGMTMDVAFTMPNEEGLALRVRMLPYEAYDYPGSTVFVPLLPAGAQGAVRRR
ncbi:multicopper oxidase domain-containing protein [Gemmatimonas sp.]